MLDVSGFNKRFAFSYQEFKVPLYIIPFLKSNHQYASTNLTTNFTRFPHFNPEFIRGWNGCKGQDLSVIREFNLNPLIHRWGLFLPNDFRLPISSTGKFGETAMNKDNSIHKPVGSVWRPVRDLAPAYRQLRHDGAR